MNDLSEADWNDLLDSIEEGLCTPFLGAGASTPWLPLGDEMAKLVCERFGVLFDQHKGLPRVAQNASHVDMEMQVRRFVAATCKLRNPPDFSNPMQLHRVLAMLPLRYYVTTNYDDYMSMALSAARRSPITEICQWHRATWDEKVNRRSKSTQAHEASIANPVVFHLHGSFADRESMVLTEDDYLDFLTATTTHTWMLPPTIRKAFSQKILFLGYALEDMTFKVAIRKLSSQVRRMDLGHLTVQLVRDESDTAVGQQRRKVQLDTVRALLGRQAQIYWGTCDEFARELYAKWTARQGRPGPTLHHGTVGTQLNRPDPGPPPASP